MPLEETNNDPVITALPLNGNPLPAAFSAYEAVAACEDDTAQLAVPKYPTPFDIELVYEEADTLELTINISPLYVKPDSPFTVLAVPVAVST
jgi:hypothetical protein